jgi:uncharacterized membrane protein YfcA
MSATAEHIGPALAVVALGAGVHGVLGFGCSLVWMSFFPLFTTIPDAVGVLQPLAIGLNCLLLSQLWRHACLRDLMPLTTSAPVGIVFGLWVATSCPSHVINGLLGAFLLLYVAKSCREDYDSGRVVKDEESVGSNLIDLRDEGKEQVADGPPRRLTALAFPAGFLGGFLTSAFGTGGPAILVFAREARWEGQPQKFRANLQVVFFSMNVLAVSSQAYIGIIHKGTLRVSAVLVPALVLGGFLGNSLASKVRKDVFRILVLGGLTVMGALFVFKAFQEQQQQQQQRGAIYVADADHNGH